ncbi:hypothetical protein EI427_18880 [Flammeovirga pectinis]|uniref:Band 7 domain-containing protein n=1 Tax=Flammeovirga pectinis TaxID=2494373 RepID=A0A3S9P7P6_9BACT|nr:hypothetical protein [Flammeovirga pectinis]AZQ64216.1 hypothetical protein EI427_18880 [Flammeovirga pectinis]
MAILFYVIVFLSLVYSILSIFPKLQESYSFLKPKVGAVTFLSAVAIIIISNAIMWAEPGYQYFITYPNGQKSAIMSEGYHFTWFGKVQPWSKYIDITTEDVDDDDNSSMKAVPIRFIDQVTALGYPSVRVQMPKTEKAFIDVAIKFRSQENLVSMTLIPTIREQLVNTGYMYAAQDYISGDAQSFRQTFEEQLKDGSYEVRKIETADTLFDQAIQQDVRGIKEIRKKYLVEKVADKNGHFKRIPNEISENHILISQVVLPSIDMESSFKKRLESQRDESANRQLEIQRIETAKAAQSRILAEGERDKAEERVKREKEQVSSLIAIETQLKQEETNKKLAKIKFETAQLEAKRDKVIAETKAYANKKLVASGLTPEQKSLWEYRRDSVKWANISKIKLPEQYFSGQGGSKGGDLLSTIIAGQIASSKLK